MDNFFENIYNTKSDNLNSIPWAKLEVNEYLKDYLNNNANTNNKKALVIGCGIGDDADYLASKGYEVDAFDISPSAINIAKKRFCNKNINFFVQDIFSLPNNMINSYDFVYEGLTIQSINPKFKNELIKIISSLGKKDSHLLLYSNFQDDIDNYDGPPWPLYKRDFALFLSYDYKLLDYKEEFESKSIAPYKAICLYHKTK